MDFDDIVKIVDQVKALKARLAAAEAERYAARRRVQDCETRMMRYAIELAEMQAERDASRAGEARAVAVLHRCRLAQRRMLDQWRDADAAIKAALWRGLHECEKLADGVLDQAQPALDWLAQQRAEAAAEALEEFAYDADGIEELITCNILDLRSALRTRAAAIGASQEGQ